MDEWRVLTKESKKVLRATDQLQRDKKKEKKENKKQVEKDPWSKFRTRNLRYESLENGIALDWRCVNHWVSIMGTVNF